ncbi:MAG: ATPase, T2SS/T4P/T4SS family, partial [Acidobacteriota bacterium]
LGYWLVRLGYIPVETLSRFFSENRNAGFFEDHLIARRKASEVVPRSLAHYYKIVPLKVEEKVLTVALAEVNHAHLVELLAEITGYSIDALILPQEEARALIQSSYQLGPDRGIQFSSLEDHSFVITDTKAGIKALTAGQWKSAISSGERLRSLIAEAIKEKFRQILIHPNAEQSVVYFKKDALKQSEFSLTSAEHEDLAFLIFTLARMNPLQQKMPQHGRFTVMINDRKIVMIVNAAPSIYGLRFLLEMFDEKILKHSYEEVLKPFPNVRNQIEQFLVKGTKGILAITGPEGSGRTHFLYRLLSKAKETFDNIHTLENSIRYPLNGIHQNEVLEEQMDRVLEEYLFQSPDLLAVSAVKSVRGAEVAFLLAARMPVIMLLSSYDSFKAIEWLCVHNLKSPIKAGLLHTVISPRKIPGICPHCSIPVDGHAEFQEGKIPAERQWKMNQGCEHCRNKDNLHSETFFECFP